ncbi:YybS family protein [Irregularibacter muris]|uniref:YybS family protein n=1 Tax=Irregularibacter muris TaxID=1796619 RepID=A0AAE3HGX6_9FIRM|nr:YybS family protein [Irregularibacter muris]MCR1899272.1 YybS family protein [Irregularibacter muris]
MNKKFNTRAMTEGAIMAALTALLGVLSYYIPFLNLLIFIWPIPIIVLGIRQGMTISLLATFIASVLVSIFTPIVYSGYLILMYGLLGIVLGYAYQKQWSISKTALLGYVTSLLSIVVMFQFYRIIVGVDILTEMTEMMKLSMGEITNMYQKMGVDPNILDQAVERIENMMQTVNMLFPAILLTIPMAITGINMLVTQKLLPRLGYHQVAKIQPLRNWKLPSHANYGLFFIIVLTTLGQYLKIPNFDMVHRNVLYLILMVFFIQGLAVISYFFHHRNFSKGIKFIGYLFILLTPFLQIMIHFIGLFDVVFNFRNLIKHNGR